jgi:putative transcriptional regulator
MTHPHDPLCTAASDAKCILSVKLRSTCVHLQRAVILVVQHSSQHSVGLVLNHASALSVDDLHIKSATRACFGRAALRLGGRHCHKSVLLLHGEARIADAHCIAPGLYTGGLQSAQKRIKARSSAVDRFCLLAGYTSWAPGQLEDEVASGRWVLASAAPKLVLDIACDEEQSEDAWARLLSYAYSSPLADGIEL